MTHTLAWVGTSASVSAGEPSAFTRWLGPVGHWLSLGFKVGGVDITIGRTIGALLLFIAFVLASALLKRLLRRYGDRTRHINQSTLYTVQRLLHYLLLVIGLLVALSMVGVPMDKMAVFAGALGVGLGFGLQAIFNNFISGLILLFDRSLKVGDFVELASGVHGHVREIRIRATLISTNDDIDILVPNAEFVTGRVVNWTLREVARRQKIPFHVAYGTDKELVKKAALEAAAEVPCTLTTEGPRAPQVWLSEFGDSWLEFRLVVWLNAEATRRVGAVTAAYNWALHSALEKYHIHIPLPQRDLHVKTWMQPQDQQPPDDASGDGADASADNDAAHSVESDVVAESVRREAAARANEADKDPDANVKR